MNQPGGFKCPSCPFSAPVRATTLDFRENVAKPMAFDVTKRRMTGEFFAKHVVTEPMAQSGFWLQMPGHLTEPLRCDAASDRFVPVTLP